jgi:ligand-binding SRPBCC domain-containing protein
VATITIYTFISAPQDVCFDLALDVSAHMKSASFSGERLVEPGRTSGMLQLGDLVTFEGRHFGIRQRFTTRIIELQRPDSFVDEMVRGSFKSLRHVHKFHIEDDQTVMRDTLTWDPPLGILGDIADVLFLRRHMERFVRKKQTQLKRLAEEKYRMG